MFHGKKRSMYNTRLSIEKQKYESYRDITHYIQRVVHHLIEGVMNIISNMDVNNTEEQTNIKFTRSVSFFETMWPTCGNINVQNALESIKREMTIWNNLPLLENWMFHVGFVGLKRECNTEFYVYEVLWSIPTPAYPEPQVTVSVYFFISASCVHPSHFPVDVTYVFEGHQFAHRLNMIFRPKWLYDLIDMKTMIFKTLDF